MKAKTLVLILGIGLMCLTGFGNTTADLTENSTTDLIQMDYSANVVSVSVMEINFDSYQIGTAFSLAENKAALPETELANRISSETNLTINLTDDVGWQFKTNYEKENPTLKNTKFHFSYHAPRDGIMYDSFHFS